MRDTDWEFQMLEHLKRQIDFVMDIPTVECSPNEIQKFKKEHPGAHLVIGDFEIKCLCPEKYNIENL